jgi:hypothetical protein
VRLTWCCAGRGCVSQCHRQLSAVASSALKANGPLPTRVRSSCQRVCSALAGAEGAKRDRRRDTEVGAAAAHIEAFCSCRSCLRSGTQNCEKLSYELLATYPEVPESGQRPRSADTVVGHLSCSCSRVFVGQIAEMASQSADFRKSGARHSLERTSLCSYSRRNGNESGNSADAAQARRSEIAGSRGCLATGVKVSPLLNGNANPKIGSA